MFTFWECIRVELENGMCFSRENGAFSPPFTNSLLNAQKKQQKKCTHTHCHSIYKLYKFHVEDNRMLLSTSHFCLIRFGFFFCFKLIVRIKNRKISSDAQIYHEFLLQNAQNVTKKETEEKQTNNNTKLLSFC